MSNRSRIVALAMVAGIASVAVANPDQVDVAAPAVKGPHYLININGGTTTRSLKTVEVYDNVDFNGEGTPAYAGSTNANSPYLGEWMTIELPRTGSGTLGNFSQTLEEFTFGLSSATGGVFHDVVITFWDDPRAWGIDNIAGTGGFQASSTAVLGAFRVSLSEETPLWSTFGFYTVTGLSALSTPIVLADNYVGVTIDTYFQGTNTRDLAVYNIFNFDQQGPRKGWSEDRFARDVDANGVITESEMARVFSGVSDPANMFFNFAVIYCDSDFDGSGFSDTDDFDAMVQAFQAGC